MEWVLLALLIVSNYLWFVAFYHYRKEVKRQWRKAGYGKYKKAKKVNTNIDMTVEANKLMRIAEQTTGLPGYGVSPKFQATLENIVELRIAEVENGKSNS